MAVADLWQSTDCAEPDPEKARVLQRIADEAEQGVLVTADWLTPAKYMGERPGWPVSELCVGLLAYPARGNYLRDAPRALAISLEVNLQPGVIMKK
jgi:hypothetical protein